jgi:hypothetical protein
MSQIFLDNGEAMQKLLILFSADDPDDGVWNERGDLEIPGGRGVAQRIAASLTSRGARCSEIEQRSFYGWEFDIELDNFSSVAVLQQSDEWLLVLDTPPSILGWLIGRKDSQEGLQAIGAQIKSVLDVDEHVSNVRIVSEDEYHDYVRKARS